MHYAYIIVSIVFWMLSPLLVQDKYRVILKEGGSKPAWGLFFLIIQVPMLILLFSSLLVTRTMKGLANGIIWVFSRYANLIADFATLVIRGRDEP